MNITNTGLFVTSALLTICIFYLDKFFTCKSDKAYCAGYRDGIREYIHLSHFTSGHLCNIKSKTVYHHKTRVSETTTEIISNEEKVEKSH